MQEPDEPIRTFVARLRGFVYFCNLSTQCHSQPCSTASNVNSTLLMVLVKGLVDLNIQGEILIEVEQMDLETTIVLEMTLTDLRMMPITT